MLLLMLHLLLFVQCMRMRLALVAGHVGKDSIPHCFCTLLVQGRERATSPAAVACAGAAVIPVHMSGIGAAAAVRYAVCRSVRRAPVPGRQRRS